MHQVRMPPLGTTSDELLIVGWLKAEGEQVAAGEALLEVESDKATLEVEATAGGTLLRIERQAGETVQAGAIVGWIGAAGETVPKEAAARKEASPAATSSPSAFSHETITSSSLVVPSGGIRTGCISGAP